jgi:hypothetical protein
MSEEDSSVFRRVLADATKLARIEDSMLRGLKLKTVSKQLLNPLAQGVQQNDRTEHLGSFVVRFPRLWDDNRPGVLEIRRPITYPKTSIGYREDDGAGLRVQSYTLPVAPRNVVRARRGLIRGRLQRFEKFGQ